MKPITILIIDDHALIREGWSLVLNSDKRFKVIAESGTAEKGIELSKLLRPNVVLIDINLPGMSSMDAIPLIKKFSPGTKVLVISVHALPTYVRKLIQVGASGYVTKDSSKEEMIDAILRVNKGEKYICQHIKEVISTQLLEQDDSESKISLLSPRELEVISLIKKGLTSKEIGEKLDVTMKTIEVHRFNILRKLKLKNGASLVQFINKHFPDL